VAWSGQGGALTLASFSATWRPFPPSPIRGHTLVFCTPDARPRRKHSAPSPLSRSQVSVAFGEKEPRGYWCRVRLARNGGEAGSEGLLAWLPVQGHGRVTSSCLARCLEVERGAWLSHCLSKGPCRIYSAWYLSAGRATRVYWVVS
jgi:hypothetical protein